MITSNSNARVKRVRSLQARRRTREREGVFVIEGLRLVQEAIEAAASVQLVLYTESLDERGRALVQQMESMNAEVRMVSEAVMAACSDTESPSGLLAVLSLPSPIPPRQVTLALVIDRLADPGNLGTLLRTALAAGVDIVFLTTGTVDPFNPKVVRGAMGAHFHLPLVGVQPEELATRLQGLQIWLAEAGRGTPHHQVDWRPPVALIIGGEAHGPREALAHLAHGSVHIPMSRETESLNAAVAAAVILFEIVRQRGKA